MSNYSDDTHDPNVYAEKLAKLSMEMAQQVQTALKASAQNSGEDNPNKVAEVLTDSFKETQEQQPKDEAAATVSNDQPADDQRLDDGQAQDEADQTQQDVPIEENETNETQQSDDSQQYDDGQSQETYGSKIIVKGAKFGLKKPKQEDVRTHDVIVVNHVDEKRDAAIGMNLSKYNLNYVFGTKDERDHKFSALFKDIDPNYLPATTDLRPTWGTILDQLDLGSCVSNSVAYCVRYAYRKEQLGDFTPSRLFIYYNGRLQAGYPLNEDSGLTIRDGYKSVAQYSVCSENNWPYIVSKFSQRPPDQCYDAAKQHPTFRYIALDNDAVQIKKSLKDGFPVSFGTALFESFMSAETARTGIVPVPNASKDQRCGGHAMTICGHDDGKKAFLVCNNWGAGWGQGGFCWFPYEYMLNDDLTGDFWSIRYWA